MAKTKPTPQQILKKAKWDNNTVYTSQITYECDDGYKISAVYTEGNNTRADTERNLVNAVLEHLGFEVE